MILTFIVIFKMKLKHNKFIYYQIKQSIHRVYQKDFYNFTQSSYYKK